MAVAYISPSGVFTGFDNSGNIVSGGLLHTYLAGTTTDTPTYTTNDTTGVQHSNPVVMDSAGRAVIFLDPAVSYKFVFATAADVTLWTSDNITTSIADGTITLAMMADLAQDKFIGRVTASTGVPETATITSAARTVLDDTSVSAMVNTLGGATAVGSGALVRASAPQFTAQPTTIVGTGSGAATVGGTLNSQYTVAGSVTTGRTQLLTYTLPANSLSANGKGIRVKAGGYFAANANNKTLEFTFGTVSVGIAPVAGYNDQYWNFEATLIRIASAQQSWLYYTMIGPTAVNAVGSSLSVFTEDETATIAVAFYGTATTTNDILQHTMTVEAI